MHRENTISEHLRDLLDVYPEVNISGIGLFAIVQRDAWIDVSNNELYPPTKTLSIRPESPDTIDLLNAVGSIKDEVEDLMALREKINSHVSELKLKGTTRIVGIGVVNKLSDQELNLVDVHLQWAEGTAYLPVLEIFPLSKPPVESGTISQVIDEVETPSADFIEPVSYQEVGKQSFLPLIVLCLGVISLLWYFKGCNQYKLGNETKIEKASKSEILPIDTLNSLNSKYASYLSSEIIEQGCKIVVGSFAERYNAESQLKKFSESAYTVQLSQNGNSYRVIITFNCNDYNLKDYLEKVKEELTPNAWYLSPNIKVEDL